MESVVAMGATLDACGPHPKRRLKNAAPRQGARARGRAEAGGGLGKSGWGLLGKPPAKGAKGGAASGARAGACNAAVGSTDLSPLPCPDRTSFYEEYGVLRDVHQNHLTELLMALAMELPANVSRAEDVLRCKLQAFASLQGLGRGSAVIGQYEAYSAHVREELQKGRDFFSRTPTYAGEPRG